MSTEPDAGASDAALSAADTDRVRTRVRLLIEITARAGSYRKGLLKSAAKLSPQEAAIIVDLSDHGLQVPQLRDVLYGGHVLVDDPELYERWHFPDVSHDRISSHHHSVDKKQYPDVGMRGPVVREKLHGRTAAGTWMQLEKTPAAMGAKKVPTMNDVRHLFDYIVYRITRSNVGPWGLSKTTEKRPLYLSPSLASQTSIDPTVAEAVRHALHRVEDDDDTTSASADLAHLFPPPEREDPIHELGRALHGRGGRGLFGNSEVYITEAPAKVSEAIIRQANAVAPPLRLDRVAHAAPQPEDPQQ